MITVVRWMLWFVSMLFEGKCAKEKPTCIQLLYPLNSLVVACVTTVALLGGL